MCNNECRRPAPFPPFLWHNSALFRRAHAFQGAEDDNVYARPGGGSETLRAGQEEDPRLIWEVPRPALFDKVRINLQHGIDGGKKTRSISGFGVIRLCFVVSFACNRSLDPCNRSLDCMKAHF